MSKTVQEIYVTNPTTVVADTDLYYLVQSPYTPGTDAAISGASLKSAFGTGGTINPGLANQLGYYASSGSTISGLATLANGTLITSAAGIPSISQTLPNAVQNNITRLGTIVSIGAPLGPTFGGTGVNNGANTATFAGNLDFAAAFTTSGAFAVTQTYTGITNVTFPTSGTLATTSQLLVSPLNTKGDIWVWSTTNDRLPVATGDGKILQVSSGAATGLAYSTATYPTVATSIGSFLYANGTNYVASTSLWPNTVGSNGKFLISDGTTNGYSTSTIPTSAGATANKVLLSDGTNYVLSTPTFPNASATSGKIIKSDGTNWTASTETYAAPGSSGNLMKSDGTNWTSATAAASLPAGAQFNTQSTNLTTTTSIASSSFSDVTGLSVTITPTSSSNKVLVRAIVNCSTPATEGAAFQLVRGSTAIGVGAAAGNRTQAGGDLVANVVAHAQNVVMEFLDSPATTSSTTYKVQALSFLGGTIQFNRSITDTNLATFARTSSTITVCEIVV